MEEELRENTLANILDNLIESIYEINLVGGPLHIVLDDGNVENEDIQLCITDFIPNEKNVILKQLCFAAAEVLLKMPKERRHLYIQCDSL